MQSKHRQSSKPLSNENTPVPASPLVGSSDASKFIVVSRLGRLVPREQIQVKSSVSDTLQSPQFVKASPLNHMSATSHTQTLFVTHLVLKVRKPSSFPTHLLRSTNALSDAHVANSTLFANLKSRHSRSGTGLKMEFSDGSRVTGSGSCRAACFECSPSDDPETWHCR
jgi:hypothetical protein